MKLLMEAKNNEKLLEDHENRENWDKILPLSLETKINPNIGQELISLLLISEAVSALFEIESYI